MPLSWFEFFCIVLTHLAEPIGILEPFAGTPPRRVGVNLAKHKILPFVGILLKREQEAPGRASGGSR
jgi:hypothetical protein